MSHNINYMLGTNLNLYLLYNNYFKNFTFYVHTVFDSVAEWLRAP